MTQQTDTPIRESSGYARPSDVEEMQRLTQRLLTMKQTSKDYIVPAAALWPTANASLHGSVDLDGYVNRGDEASAFDLSKRGLLQLAEKTGIPPKFAVDTVTHTVTDSRGVQSTPFKDAFFTLMRTMVWDKKQKFLLRTVAGTVRAVLSDQYLPVDNYDLMLNVGGLAMEHQWQVRKMHIDDDGGRFYLELWAPDWAEKIEMLRRPGDHRPIVAAADVEDSYVPAVVISNSEVGEGSLRIEPRAIRLVCMNGLLASYTMRRAHIGEKYTNSGVISDDTKSKRSAAVLAEARDYIFAAMDREKFKMLLTDIGVLQQVDIADPVKMVEKVSTAAELPKELANSVLNYLIMGGDMTAYGMLQALTRTAQDAADVEVQMDIERRAFDVVKKAVAV